jgi:hypothetical protein
MHDLLSMQIASERNDKQRQNGRILNTLQYNEPPFIVYGEEVENVVGI